MFVHGGTGAGAALRDLPIPIDSAAYNAQWLLMNGQAPVMSRPIVVDPTPFFSPIQRSVTHGAL